MKRVLALGFAFVVVAAAPGARADEPLDDASRAAVRELGYAGIQDYEAGRFADAADKLERAYVVLKAPALALWSARSLAKVGRLVEASERYLDATRVPIVGEAQVQEQARREAAAERPDVEKRIARVTLRFQQATVAELSVTIDGKAIPQTLITAPRRVDPGPHTIVARRGEEPLEQKVEVAEHEDRILDFVFPVARPTSTVTPPPTSIDKPTTPRDGGGIRRPLLIASLVTGAVGLVGGLVAGGLALGKKSTLDEECRDGRCGPPQHGAVDRYNLYKALATVGFITAGVGAAGGAVLWMTAPTKQTGAASATMFGLSGTF